MEVVIPHVEDDQIILYAAVEGKDIEVFFASQKSQDDSSTNGGNQKLPDNYSSSIGASCPTAA
jgi:hypothetical protein